MSLTSFFNTDEVVCESKFYVYVYKDNGTEVYVGKGSNRRALDHIYAKTPFGELYRTRKSEGNPLELILSYAMTEEDAFRYESFMIELFYDTLLNQVRGKSRLLPVNLNDVIIRKERKFQKNRKPKIVLTRAEISARQRAKAKAKKLETQLNFN